VLAVERTVARNANVVVLMPTIRAFRPGCTLDVALVCRQGTLSEDDWWDLRMSVYGGLLEKRGALGCRAGCCGWACATATARRPPPSRHTGAGHGPPMKTATL
jgi:hypothetical protein